MRKFTKKTNLVLLVTILFLQLSCSKNDKPVAVDKPVNVYLTGEEFTNGYSMDTSPVRPFVWKNNEATLLPDATGASFSCIDGNDFYACSTDGKYWKNGVRIFLPNATTGTIQKIYYFRVVAGEVFMYGTGYDGNNNFRVVSWKDGQPTYSLGLTDFDGGIVAMTALNNDVYTLGYKSTLIGGVTYQVCKYWKNSVVNNIPNTNTTQNDNFTKIFVTNTNDVYLIGTSFNGVYKCLKNGVAVGDYINARSFVDIDVVNNDIYIVGTKYNFTENKTLPAYWKNGEATYIRDGLSNPDLKSIKIFENDIYICGSALNDEGVRTAKYWKNGVGVSVKDKITKTRANSILITN